jgi:hypothetical protein
MTALDIRQNAELDGVDVAAAVKWLARAGITQQHLRDEGIDPYDHGLLRDVVEDLLRAVTAENAIADQHQALYLQSALMSLYTTAERVACRKIAQQLHERLIAPRQHRAYPDEPRYADACLYAD